MKRAYFQLHIAVFLAGFTAVLGKLIQLQEAWLVWYRLLLTLIIGGTLFIIRKEVQKLPFREMMRIFGIGALVALHWLFFYASIKFANASVSLVCLAATGFFTSINEPLITGRKMQWKEVLFSLISLGGIYIIFDFNPDFKVGIIFGLLSALGASIFPVLNGAILKRVNARTLTIYELGGAFLTMSILMPGYLHFFPETYVIPTFSDWIWLLILSALCTVWAFDLQLKALRRIPPFSVSLSYSLEPAYGIIMAFLFLGEARYFGPSFFVGALLVMLSVLMNTLLVFRSRKRLYRELKS